MSSATLPLTPVDLSILTAAKDFAFDLFDKFGLPRHPTVDAIAEQIGVDRNHVWYDIKKLKRSGTWTNLASLRTPSRNRSEQVSSVLLM